MGIPTVEECASLCEDQFAEAFTHFGSESSPYQDTFQKSLKSFKKLKRFKKGVKKV